MKKLGIDLKNHSQIDVLTDPGTHTFKKAEGGRWLNPVTKRFLTERGLQKMLDGYIKAGCVVLPIDPRGDKQGVHKKIELERTSPGMFVTFGPSVLNTVVNAVEKNTPGPSLPLVYGKGKMPQSDHTHALLQSSTYVSIYCLEPGMPVSVSPARRRLAAFSYNYTIDRWGLDLIHDSFRDHLCYEYNYDSSAEIFAVYANIRPTTIIELMRIAIECANEVNPLNGDIIVNYSRS